MVASIELIEQLLGELESRARELHSSVEAVAIKAIEDAIQKDIAGVESEGTSRRRVRLPLIPSANPGSLKSLTNADIDGILGD